MDIDSTETSSGGKGDGGQRVVRGCFLALAGATAAGAPWMLGGETVRTEWWLLAGGCLTLLAGLCVRVIVPRGPSAADVWRVTRWSLAFGLLFMALIGVQAGNPSHRVVLADRVWRIEALPALPWAP